MKNKEIQITKIKDENGKIGYAVVVGDKDLNQLTNQINDSQKLLFFESAQDPDFNGNLDIYIHPVLNQLNTELKMTCEKIIEKIDISSLDFISQMLNVEIRFRISYGENNLIAEISSSDNPNSRDTNKINENEKLTNTKDNAKWWKFW